MKDIHEILQQKERDLARVRAEIDALRMVIPLLGGELSTVPESLEPNSESEEKTPSEARANGTEGPTFSALGSEGGFWKRRR